MLEGLMRNDFPLTLQHVLRRMRSSQAQVITLEQPGSLSRATRNTSCSRYQSVWRFSNSSVSRGPTRTRR